MSAATLISFEEFERLDSGADHVELLEGELIRLPPPQKKHMESSENLYERLKSAIAELKQRDPARPVGRVHIEMGYSVVHDPRSWLRPDVSLTWPEQRVERFYIGAPMIAFEIVSEFDTAKQIHGKVQAYLTHGAEEVWVIYPDDWNAWVYSKSSARLETRAVTSALLPGIEILFDAFL